MLSKVAIIVFVLPLNRFTDLATEPIYSISEWETVPTSFDGAHRSSVTADLFCEKCGKEKTFSGSAYSREELIAEYQLESDTLNRMPSMPFYDYDDGTDTVEEMIVEGALSVGDATIVQLKCLTCGSLVYICYAIEFNQEQSRRKNVFDEQNKEPDKFRVHKIGEYPNQEATRLRSLGKYMIRFPKEYQMLTQAERAYRSSLGIGAIVYIRKAYETLLHGVLDEHSIVHPKTFRQLLSSADDVAHIVPDALNNKAYGLFGELSDIVHGNTEDEWGLEKFENLRDVFTLILDNILEKERQEELASKIKTDTHSHKP